MSEAPWTEAFAEDGLTSMKRRPRPDGREQVQLWKLGEAGQRVLVWNCHFERTRWRAFSGGVPIVTTRGEKP